MIDREKQGQAEREAARERDSEWDPQRQPEREIEQRLIQLRDATESISAHPQFAARIMARLELERVGWLRMVPSLWQRTLPVAMLLAMMSAVWAYRTTQAADARIAIASVTDDPAEMDW